MAELRGNLLPFLLLLIVSQHAGSSSPFYDGESSFRVDEGQDVSGLCPVSVSDVSDYAIESRTSFWLPRGFQYEASVENGITIKKVQAAFHGDYFCRVTQDGVVKMSPYFTLIVIPAFRRPPTVSLTKTKLLIRAGEPFQVTCVVTDVREIEANWTAGPSMTVTGQSEFHSYSNFTRSLTLQSHAAQLNESGLYTCQGANTIGAANATFTLEVIEFGYLHLSTTNNNTTEAMVGEDLVLWVYIDAYPRPDRQYWAHMNETLQNTSDYHMETREDGENRYVSELRMINLTGGDSGLYTFYGSNSDANSSISFNIFVKARPEILIAERCGGSMLRCVAAGLPLPSIEWHYCPRSEQRCSDSPPIPPCDVKISRENSAMGRMVVESAVDVSPIQKSGTVHCVASNAVAWVSFVFHLEVTWGSWCTWCSLQLSAVIALAVALGVAIAILLYKCAQPKPTLMFLRRWNVVDDIRGSDYLETDPTEPPNQGPLEFRRERLTLGKVLGSGDFGLVYEAVAHSLFEDGESYDLTVAVKMLRATANSSEQQALISELSVLSHLGHHQNIVSLLGACTMGGPLLLIIEFCHYGDLMNFLQKRRESFNCPKPPENAEYLHVRSDRDDGQREEMKDYMKMNPIRPQEEKPESSNQKKVSFATAAEEEEAPLETKDLISFSHQIAHGMNFLTSKRCIHRDLAARNVLLTRERIPKICDFGLARNLQSGPHYVQRGNARLPIKWMAPESLFHFIYSFESDVWSYGILLWEIFSLGSSPYPHMPLNNMFYKKIKDGYRMASPEYAPAEVYEIMKSCWRLEPAERPNFEQIILMLERHIPET